MQNEVLLAFDALSASPTLLSQSDSPLSNTSTELAISKELLGDMWSSERSSRRECTGRPTAGEAAPQPKNGSGNSCHLQTVPALVSMPREEQPVRAKASSPQHLLSHSKSSTGEMTAQMKYVHFAPTTACKAPHAERPAAHFRAVAEMAPQGLFDAAAVVHRKHRPQAAARRTVSVDEIWEPQYHDPFPHGKPPSKSQRGGFSSWPGLFPADFHDDADDDGEDCSASAISQPLLIVSEGPRISPTQSSATHGCLPLSTICAPPIGTAAAAIASASAGPATPVEPAKQPLLPPELMPMHRPIAVHQQRSFSDPTVPFTQPQDVAMRGKEPNGSHEVKRVSSLPERDLRFELPGDSLRHSPNQVLPEPWLNSTYHGRDVSSPRDGNEHVQPGSTTPWHCFVSAIHTLVGCNSTLVATPR